MGRAYIITVVVRWLIVLVSTIAALAPSGLTGSETLRPTGDGATHTWTPSEGTDHWDDIDEVISDSTVTTVRSAVNGELDYLMFAAGSIPADSLVDSVVVFIRAMFESGGAGSYDTLQILMYDSTTAEPPYLGTAFALTTSWADYQRTMTTNPVTAAAWTVEQANATYYQYGYKTTARNKATGYVTQLWKTVYYHAAAPAATWIQSIMPVPD